MLFLKNRILSIKIYDILSNQFETPSGVPQGSFSAGQLFIIFINDLIDTIGDKNALLFADDVKIFSKINSISDCHELQTILDKFFVWCYTNDMILNFDKCVVTSYKTSSKNKIIFDYNINKNLLNRKNIIKDLGIFYDDQLKFDKHLMFVINKANKNLAFIKRSTDAIKSLYISIIRPVLLYGDIIWRPNKKNGINKIEQIQHKILLFLAFKDNLNFPRFCQNYDCLYKKYNLPSISSVRT